MGRDVLGARKWLTLLHTLASGMGLLRNGAAFLYVSGVPPGMPLRSHGSV